MTEDQSDLYAILERVADTPHEERLLNEIFEWESERVNNEYRRNKMEKMEEAIEGYLEDSSQ